MSAQTSTFRLARANGAGAILTNGEDHYEVSDYSPSTGEVYGWPVPVDQWGGTYGEGERGKYQRLPDHLTLTTKGR